MLQGINVIRFDALAPGKETDGVKVGEDIHQLSQQGLLSCHERFHGQNQPQQNPYHQGNIQSKPDKQGYGESNIIAGHEDEYADNVNKTKCHCIKRMVNGRRRIVAHLHQPRRRAASQIFLKPPTDWYVR